MQRFSNTSFGRTNSGFQFWGPLARTNFLSALCGLPTSQVYVCRRHHCDRVCQIVPSGVLFCVCWHLACSWCGVDICPYGHVLLAQCVSSSVSRTFISKEAPSLLATVEILRIRRSLRLADADLQQYTSHAVWDLSHTKKKHPIRSGIITGRKFMLGNSSNQIMHYLTR